ISPAGGKQVALTPPVTLDSVTAQPRPNRMPVNTTTPRRASFFCNKNTKYEINTEVSLARRFL
ncbi:hypothetical protein ACVGWB_03180, partial [Enterobacter mori]